MTTAEKQYSNNDVPSIDHDLLVHYRTWMLLKNYSPMTVRNYTIYLKALPGNVKEHLARDFAGKKNVVNAYRSYLKFLSLDQEVLSREHMHRLLETFKPPVTRGSKKSEKKWGIPKKQWSKIIRMAPTKFESKGDDHVVAKMGIWLGFQFGLRLGEITHLRLDDVVFRDGMEGEIHVQKHRKNKNQHEWYPKYKKEAEIPFTVEQGKVLEQYINEKRPVLDHPYLLYIPNNKGGHWGRPLARELPKRDRTFQRWCQTITYWENGKHLHPHVLRYSAATNLYYASDKDIYLVRDFLRHESVDETIRYLQIEQQEFFEKTRKAMSG